ncbi:MAG: cysteine--tRNA ligase [candidate division Zixibacteria bacterium]|nr:cysteine--tRNA ligase [candidate division Zixibacteria bacterium]
MSLLFYNTLTRNLEEFVPIEKGKVKLYTCGPTVWNYPHIGNYRTFIFEDLLRRYLKYKGFEVLQVMNLTDIDDKIIASVNKQKVSLDDFTAQYKKIFFEDLDTLNIQRAEVYPEATKHIDEMVKLIQQLLEKGHAYKSDGAIYFKISSFPDYGKLAKMNLAELKTGARVASDEYEKEEVSDFALWKGWDEKDGDVFWETELGKGRPGWHIECSAMSMKYLGPHFDIHTGGVDNIFPHHENEIAQSQGGTGEKFVNYWLHAAHLLVENKKMSKSLGNFYTLRDLLQKNWDQKAIRYLLLGTHYRQQLNFTFDGLEASKNALQRLYDFMDGLKDVKTVSGKNPEVEQIVKNTRQKFEEALDNDLNISAGLAAIFDMVRDINKLLRDNLLSNDDAMTVLELTCKLDSVLGVLKRPAISIDQTAEELIQKREKARQDKNWKMADQIRDQLAERGIVLEDTSGGTKWKKKV